MLASFAGISNLDHWPRTNALERYFFELRDSWRQVRRVRLPAFYVKAD